MGLWPWDGDLGKWVKVRKANTVTHKIAQNFADDVPNLGEYFHRFLRFLRDDSR